jgi:hypothetical protein
MPKPKQRRKSITGEYRLKIDAYKPETMPMARLAEYMRELANLLGERDAVHFLKLEPGSTVLVHKVDHEAIPKVRARIASVRRKDAPREALRAFDGMNKLLRDDNAVASLHEHKGGAVVIRFPGREEAEEDFPSVRQQGAIDGRIMRVGGEDETQPIWLEAEGKKISGCFTSRAIAKELGKRMYESVRLFGRGRWKRDNDGNWSLLDFKIESFEPLEEIPLSDALAQLRAIPTEWDDKSYAELEVIRHGGKRNGGH